MPPIVPIFAKGKKWERILAMSPLFRIGKVKIKKDHRDFIDEWINYDSTMSRPKDDCLDSVEIALRCAGALLGDYSVEDKATSNVPDWILADRPSNRKREDFVDETMGSIW